jgi:hypothetical protein
MTEEVFGWAIRHWMAGIMLPVSATRVEAIREYIHMIDAGLGPRGYASGLDPHEERAWRRAKRRYDVVAVRVRVTPAFEERP